MKGKEIRKEERKEGGIRAEEKSMLYKKEEMKDGQRVIERWKRGMKGKRKRINYSGDERERKEGEDKQNRE